MAGSRYKVRGARNHCSPTNRVPRTSNLMSHKVPVLVVLLALLAAAGRAQLVTPRERDTPVYRSPNSDRMTMIGQVEPDRPWRLEFSAAEAPVKLPAGAAAPGPLKFLLPGRDTGVAIFAKVRGPGKSSDGWVEPDKVDISPDPYWKLRPNALLFVPLVAGQIPAITSGQAPANLGAARCSYFVLVNPEGKVAGLRLIDGDSDAALETAVKEWRFPPIRLEGDPAYMVLALRAEPPRK